MKRYYRKNRSSVALFLVSNLLAAGSSVFMSFLLGAFADSAMEGDLSRVWKIALVTLFYLCIETFFAFLLDYSRDIIVQRVGRDLRADAVRKIEALSYMEKSEKDLYNGDFLVMVSDGVLEYLHVPNPEETMQEIIESIETNNATILAKRILERVLLFTGGKAADDMTVLATAIWEK